MKRYKKNGNGGMKKATDLENKKIDFPVTFRLKAVMVGTVDDDQNKQKLTRVFEKLDIEYKYHDKRLSSKGAYVSFTYIVTLLSKQQMDRLYADLKSIKELKFAV
jgi:putative lipoic acid-binding regulatory protein